jgi:hypothetical protein
MKQPASYLDLEPFLSLLERASTRLISQGFLSLVERGVCPWMVVLLQQGSRDIAVNLRTP